MKSRKGIGSTYMPHILAGAFVLAVTIVIVLQFLGGEGVRNNGQIDPELALKINELEERLATLESIETRVIRLEDQWKAFETFMNKYESTGENSPDKIDDLIRRIKSLEKKSAPKHTGASSATLKKEVKKVKTTPPKKKVRIEAKYHIVQENDTLYSISKKYKLSLKELRRLNRLDVHDAIHPGQKLVIKAAYYK